MIQCANCENCKSMTVNIGSYKIDCVKNGAVAVARAYEDKFECPDYDEANEQPERKDNVMVVLKCGRDFTTYVDGISGIEDIAEICRMFNSETRFYIGNILAKNSEVAAILYIGD